MKSITLPMGEYALGVNVDPVLGEKAGLGLEIDFYNLGSLAVVMAAPETIGRRRQLNPDVPPSLVINFSAGRITDPNLPALGFYSWRRDTVSKMPPADITLLPAQSIIRQTMLSRTLDRPYLAMDKEQADDLISTTLESVIRHEIAHFTDKRFDPLYDNDLDPLAVLETQHKFYKAERQEALKDPFLAELVAFYKETAGHWYKRAGRIALTPFIEASHKAMDSIFMELFGHKMIHDPTSPHELRKLIKNMKSYLLLPMEVEARAAALTARDIGRIASVDVSPGILGMMQPQEDSFQGLLHSLVFQDELGHN